MGGECDIGWWLESVADQVGDGPASWPGVSLIIGIQSQALRAMGFNEIPLELVHIDVITPFFWDVMWNYTLVTLLFSMTV